MRHRKHNVRLGRQRSHYKATMRGLVSGLIINKGITTTKVKAKEASRLADKLVTLGKDESIASRRVAYSILHDRDLVSILFKEIAPLFKERNGGYTRVMLTGRRRGDNAQMAILEFVERPKIEKPLKKKAEKEKPKVVKKEPKDTSPKIEEKKKIKPKPKKETVIKKKEEPKKVVRPPERPEKVPEKAPEKPEEKKPRPGFFKRIFGWKKQQ